MYSLFCKYYRLQLFSGAYFGDEFYNIPKGSKELISHTDEDYWNIR